MLAGKDGDEKAYCKQCKASFSVTHDGAYDVRRHFRSTGSRIHQEDKLLGLVIVE